MPWMMDEYNVLLALSNLDAKWKNVLVVLGINRIEMILIKGFEPLFEFCELMKLVGAWKMNYHEIVSLIS